MASRGRARLLLSALAMLAGFLLARLRPAADPVPAAAAPAQPAGQRGAPAAGGKFTVWPPGTRDAEVASHIEFQYAGIVHQTETALSGMWLFLVTEVLFFGGLFLLYTVYRALHGEAFAEASRHARLWIGTVNTVLLLTSSAAFAYGFGRARRGDNAGLFRACIVTAVLGLLFLGLKGYEWILDFADHLFPGPAFPIHGASRGPAELFWCFYFIATGLHGIHMIVGVGLVGWIAHAARRRRFSPGYNTPAEVVGLYWSFVDMVWLCLYPMIYLVSRGSP